MPRNYEVPEQVIPAAVIPIYKRELNIRWVGTDETNEGAYFTVEREGKMKLFRATGAKLDVPRPEFGGQTLRQLFDALGDTCLGMDPAEFDQA